MSALYNSATNLIPYWSKNAIDWLELGNEYNMPATWLLNEIVKYFLNDLTNEYAITIIICIVTMLVCYKLNMLPKRDFFCLFQNTQIVMNGIEMHNICEQKCYYDKQLLAINFYLIDKYKMKNIIYFGDDVVIGNINDLKIDSEKISISVYRNTNTNQKQENNDVSFTIKSNNIENIENFIKNANDYYHKKNILKNKVTLVCLNSENLNCSLQLNALIYVLITKYKITKYTYKNSQNNNTSAKQNNSTKENINASANANTNTNTNTNENDCDNNSQLLKENFNNIILDDIVDYYLFDDLYLTIKTKNLDINYILVSTTTDINKFIQSNIEKYNLYLNINTCNSFKYEISLLYSTINKSSYNMSYDTTQIGLAICHYLITNGYITHYTITHDKQNNNYWCNNNDSSKLTRIIREINNIKCDNHDLYISTNIEKLAKAEYGQIECNNNYLILKSNTQDPQLFINECISSYTEYTKLLNNENIIYHFIYLGLDEKKELKFSQELLCDFNDKNNILYENFDNLKHEYVDFFKAEINNLHDDEYYKRTGMKRKKSYLFYGKPGVGKTSSVTAIALYDKRHIITIPASIIQTNSEFNKLMDIKEINGIKIMSSNKILLFEEIDIGFKKHKRIDNDENNGVNIDNKNTNTNDLNNEQKQIVINTNSTNSEKTKTHNNNELSLDTILSRFDGIGNYNKLVIIATTNCIEKLDDSLKRELRLTPIEFKFLRIIDVVELVEKYFIGKISEENKLLIRDRCFAAAKLMFLCEKHRVLAINDFVKNILCNYEEL